MTTTTTLPNQRTTTYNYEQSSESGRERNVDIPWSRLRDVTPALHDPLSVTSRISGIAMCGTIITLGTAADPYVVVNVAEGAIYYHNVRNVTAWGAGPAEAAWAAANIGDPVFYDVLSDAANGIKLSLAPEGLNHHENPLFGFIVMLQEEDKDDYPKCAGISGCTFGAAVMQAGLNAHEGEATSTSSSS